MTRRTWVSTLVAPSLLFLGGGCGSSTGPEYVAKVVVEPDSAHLEPGESATFSAMPFGPRDQRYPERASMIQWDLAGAGVIAMEDLGDGTVRVTATDVGEASVKAVLGRGAGVGPVYVRPPGLASIEIEPSPVVFSQSERSTSVRAVLRDASGAEISAEGFRISWESSDENVAFMSDNVRRQANTTPLPVSLARPRSASWWAPSGPRRV